MKLVVFTTETAHHTWFVREIAKVHPLSLVAVEQRSIRIPFDTHHPFEDERDLYEREAFFQGAQVKLADVAPTIQVDSVNAVDIVTLLGRIAPDAVLVFGTGRVRSQVIERCPQAIINLHGGDPEAYRGLDSHLWAIYHKDFRSLITTLHRLNADLDDGDVILQAPVTIHKGMAIHEIRRHTTEVCVELSLAAIDMFGRLGHFLSRPQRRRGRYYSSMPAALKEVCCANFRRYTDSL